MITSSCTGCSAKSVCIGNKQGSPERTVCVRQRCGWHINLFWESMSGSTSLMLFHIKGGFGAGTAGARFPWSRCRTSFPTGQAGGEANPSVPRVGISCLRREFYLEYKSLQLSARCGASHHQEPSTLCKSTLALALHTLSPGWYGFAFHLVTQRANLGTEMSLCTE